MRSSAPLRIVRGSALGLLVVLLAGCGSSHGAAKPALTERGRDSVIAGSSLPGAGAVGGALKQSDAARQRAASLDSLTH